MNNVVSRIMKRGKRVNASKEEVDSPVTRKVEEWDGA